MPEAAEPPLLRSGLLERVTIALAAPGPRPAPGSLGAAVAENCRALGAATACLRVADATGAPLEEAEVERQVEAILAASADIDALVLDAAALYASAGRDPRAALMSCLDGAWRATRALAGRAFLARGAPGRVVYLAPCASAGAHAGAARAGLENLARTLSIEWSRHAITTVALAPGEGTSAGEVATLTAYLASPAGAYFSGCLLELGGSAARRLTASPSTGGREGSGR